MQVDCSLCGSVQRQLPLQSVPITSKVVSSNPFNGQVYSIQHYVIEIVSDLRQVGGFLHNITEILLKAG
jgi:hypothetical protein